MENISWWYNKLNGQEELQNVLSSFENKKFSMGYVTRELERNLEARLNVPHVLVTNSGTSALTISLMAKGIKPGDEVIVPDFTWIATAQAPAILGAKPVFVDCSKDNPGINISKVKKKINSKTKAIIPVHFHGRSCDMKSLLEIQDEYGIPVIEDACKALGSKIPEGYLGTISGIGCFSMGLVSLVSTCYGGFIAVKDDSLYEKIKLIRDHGVMRGEREEYSAMGSNFKISDVLSSIGLAQLKNLDERINHVKKIYNYYNEGLSSLDYIEIIPTSENEVPIVTDVRSKNREKIISFLNKNNIKAERLHLSLHKAKYFNYKSGSEFENSLMFSNEGFMLPCGPSQPLSNVERCIDILKKY